MNITLDPSRLAGLAFATGKRNAANPAADPMTPEQFAADILGVQCDQFAAEQDSAIRAELANNERIMALGKAVAAQPDKLDAVEAAVMKALQ